MKELVHGENYWEERWETGQTGWDIGYPSTPLKEFADNLEDKSIKVLIPGAGNAYEAEYMHQKGFQNVYVIDIAWSALERIKHRVPTFNESHLIHGNFFDHEGQYDLILEQTFFCALHPTEREDYLVKMKALLKPDGLLAGVLFNDSLFVDHPPYGGFEKDYRPMFERHFELEHMALAPNSIPPRMERELFFKARKNS